MKLSQWDLIEHLKRLDVTGLVIREVRAVATQRGVLITIDADRKAHAND